MFCCIDDILSPVSGGFETFPVSRFRLRGNRWWLAYSLLELISSILEYKFLDHVAGNRRVSGRRYLGLSQYLIFSATALSPLKGYDPYSQAANNVLT